MPDEENKTQNPISEESSIPPSPQEPTEPASENTAHSEPTDAPPDALESSPNDFSVKSNDIPPSNSTPTEAVNEPKTQEKQAENEPTPKPISEPVQAIEPLDSTSSPQATAQMAVNEPLKSESEPLTQTKAEATPPLVNQTSRNRVLELLAKAKNAIQFRKRKKLDRVMSLFLKQSKITNDEVEKYLHVSDATAERYLNILEKENKIKQNGKTGKAVSYSRI